MTKRSRVGNRERQARQSALPHALMDKRVRGSGDFRLCFTGSCYWNRPIFIAARLAMPTRVPRTERVGLRSGSVGRANGSKRLVCLRGRWKLLKIPIISPIQAFPLGLCK